MTLEDFEKKLAEEHERIDEKHSVAGDDRRHRSHRHHHHHQKRKHHREHKVDEDSHKRSKRSDHEIRRNITEGTSSPQLDSPDHWLEEHTIQSSDHVREDQCLKRDPWMEAPAALDIDYVQKSIAKPSQPRPLRSSKADFELRIHDKELNRHHLSKGAEGQEIPEGVLDDSAQHVVPYTFGDAGSQWRMTKLKNVFRQAEESGRSVEDVAQGVYGDLRSFDDAREEQVELDRRDTYGPGYVRKEKPSGDLFQERKMDMGVRRRASAVADEDSTEGAISPAVLDTQLALSKNSSLDQSALNRLKAQMIKAKLRGSADAPKLEAEYNTALAAAITTATPDSVVLGAMESSMLAGGRKGEVKAIESNRGRERGLVEENEDMSIEDMVREERRTRHQAGGESKRFAERIAKDGKFDNDLDYMDENATKLAKRVHKSEINLKHGAISDFQKMNRILDKCQLCHHEDTNKPPVAPLVSLATRTYLTLPTEPEISEGGACIVPVQHRVNLLECDDDEWEEIRNFMKSLTRMYHDQGRDVIFYENAAVPQRKRHAAMEVVPLPYSLGETAPAFFKEAILTADEEWTQHKKLIDTLAKAKQGLGKLAFRKTLVKEMPYFHVWFQIDGGLGHIVEDSDRWPKGDLFAREIIGGMIDKGPDIIKRQGRWRDAGDARIDGFRKRWRKFDWTRVLTDT